MQIAVRALTAASALALVLGGFIPSLASAADTNASVLEEGKKLAFDRKKGNCLACHHVADGISPGNIGPPLLSMQARFPDKATLREQVYDATTKNPNTMMPPFGKHGVLNAEEIDKIVEYIYTL